MRVERDQAVSELIGLVGAVDGICQMQAEADTKYFAAAAGRTFDDAQIKAIGATMLAHTAGSTSSPACRIRATSSCSDR